MSSKHRTFLIIDQTKRRQVLALLRKANGFRLNRPAQVSVTEFGPAGAIAIEVTFTVQVDEEAFWASLAKIPDIVDAMAVGKASGYAQARSTKTVPRFSGPPATEQYEMSVQV